MTSGSFQSPEEDREAAPVLGNTKVLICKEGQEISREGQEGNKNPHKDQGEGSRRMVFPFGVIVVHKSGVPPRSPQPFFRCLIPG